jgi:hypothetical protein
VQNTTQITQETDQNYGLFKSLLRQYVQVLLNEQYAEFKRRQQRLQEQLRIRQEQGNNDPMDLPRVEHPNLNRSHYGILLGGRPADEENGISEIPPIFALSFSKEKNLRSWALCGAVPLTRAPVNHRSVRRELSAEVAQDGIAADNDFEVLLDYRNGNFDWTSHTLQQLQAVNHTACSWLQTRGYNGNSLKASLNVQQRNLRERLARDAPNEERVQAIVANGISHNALTYTIGPSCLSTDEMFQSFEFEKRKKEYEEAKKINKSVMKAFEIQEKAKSLIAKNKVTYNVTELQLLLRWKLGGEYHQHNKKKSVELQALWLQHQGDPNPSNITLPQEIQEPTVPAIDETELGRIRQRNFLSSLNNMAGYTPAQLQQFQAQLNEMRNVEAHPV